ncbi:MAG: DUF4870 domain-containing protein [Chloroflexi bacterium]|nr:DUF4870 domain-containing protein [Chloroflexota bacterium]
MNQQYSPTDVTSDDRLWALLAYILTPLVPVIILFLEDKKNRPFIKAHNSQALALGVVEFALNIIASIISFGLLGCILGIAFLAINIYYGVKAYNGATFEIPVLTNFVRQQGW